MDQSVPSRVKQALNDSIQNSSLNFEVINTGTTSYSPTIFYILARYVLTDYDPDLIVVNVDMTDDFDDWKYQETLLKDADGNPRAAPPRDIYAAEYIDTATGPVASDLAIKLELFLFQNSYTYNLIRTKFVTEPTPAQLETPATDLYPRWAWNYKEWDARTERNVENTLDILDRLAKFTNRNDIKLMITAVPHYEQFAGHADGTGEPAFSARPHYQIERVARANDVPYLNSFEALRPAITGTAQAKYYYRGDMHFNPAGYGLWAEAHLKFLLDPIHDLLPAEICED